MERKVGAGKERDRRAIFPLALKGKKYSLMGLPGIVNNNKIRACPRRGASFFLAEKRDKIKA